MSNELHMPQWFLLVVRSRNERKVADALSTKGLEVFLPMQTEILRLQRTLALQYPLESCSTRGQGDVVEIGAGNDAIRGILVERALCVE